MKGMTTQDRLDDICRISGLSDDIVRRVFDAERQSIVKSLKKGDRATLVGRCVIRPEIRRKIEIGGECRQFIKLSASVAPSLESLLKEMTGFEIDDDDSADDIKDVLVHQIPSLV